MAMDNVNGIASTMQNPFVRGTQNLGRLLAAWLAGYTYPNRIAQGQTATFELVPMGCWGISAQEKEGCLKPVSCCGAVRQPAL